MGVSVREAGDGQGNRKNRTEAPQMPLGLRACLRSPIRAAFCEGGVPWRLEGTAFTEGGSDTEHAIALG